MTLITFGINDTSKTKHFVHIFSSNTIDVYLFVWSNELNFFQNLICNMGIAKMRDKNDNNLT